MRVSVTWPVVGQPDVRAAAATSLLAASLTRVLARFGPEPVVVDVDGGALVAGEVGTTVVGTTVVGTTVVGTTVVDEAVVDGAVVDAVVVGAAVVDARG